MSGDPDTGGAVAGRTCGSHTWVMQTQGSLTPRPLITPFLGGSGSLDNGGWGLRGACSLCGHSALGLESREPRRETPSSSVSSLSPTRQNRRAWWEKHQGTLDPLLLLHSCGSKGHLGSCGRVLLPERTTHAVQTVLESSQPFHQRV